VIRQLTVSFATVTIAIASAQPICAQTRMILTPDDDDSAAVVGAGLFIAGPADVNQRPKCEAIGVPCLSPATFGDVGAAMFGAWYVNDNVGVAWEASAYGNNWYSYGGCALGAGPGPCPVHQSNAVRAALAGVEVRTHLITDPTARWRLTARALAGPEWNDLGPHRRVIQIGAGADDYLRNGLLVHVQYDYRVSRDDRRDLSTGRFMVGVGIPIGTR
jgi:hypothetical protein